MKRKVAKKIFINEINNSSYIKRPGWEPSGILTRYGEIARVNVMGIIVSKEEDSILIDDGTGNMAIRFFDQMPQAALGDLINIVGRPREWNNAKYIVPEIMRKMEDKKWFELHKLEVQQQKAVSKQLPVEVEEGEEDSTGPYQKILNTIAILDQGDGADVQSIVEAVKDADSEKLINALIEEGEVFEIAPGRVKLLE